MKNALCAAGLGMLLATAAPAQDRATIERLNEAFSAAFRQGDMAAVAGMYAEDADLLPHGADMVRGRSAIQAFWTKTAEAIADAKLTTIDVKPLGPEAAREIGTFLLKTRGAPPQEIAGKYVVVWRKVGDEWKLATDIWNMNR
ncbi:MAG: YybH family protein [Microvirga sp.]|jgi:uncharacterized protein (TIGR02246 family)